MPAARGFRTRITGGSVSAWPVLLLLSAALPIKSHATLIWESNIGSPLNPADFSPNTTNGLQTVNLGSQYAFPFEGTTYNSVSVATSGFLWLGTPNTAQCCILSNSTAALTAFEQGSARIVPGWADLLLNLGGSVDFNQISDTNGTRSVFTYLNVPNDSANPANPAEQVSFQVQLFTSGQIIFSYMQFDRASLGTNAATVIGLTGEGDFSPDAVDFTQTPFSTSSASLYDYQTLTSGNFSLTGDSLILTPMGNGWQVTSVPAVTPEPSTFLLVAGTFLLFAILRIRQKRITDYGGAVKN